MIKIKNFNNKIKMELHKIFNSFLEKKYIKEYEKQIIEIPKFFLIVKKINASLSFENIFLNIGYYVDDIYKVYEYEDGYNIWNLYNIIVKKCKEIDIKDLNNLEKFIKITYKRNILFKFENILIVTLNKDIESYEQLDITKLTNLEINEFVSYFKILK